eukprot:g6491.t1
MDNAYVRLVEEQATIVEESRKRRLKQAERRPVFSLLLFYQIRDKSYSSPNRANALNDFFVHSDDSQDNGQNPTRGIFHEEALKEIRYVENLIAGFEEYENYCYRLQNSSQCAIPTTPVNFFFSSYPLEIKYDGKGSLRNIKDTVQDLKQMPHARFFVDLKTFVDEAQFTKQRYARQ